MLSYDGESGIMKNFIREDQLFSLCGLNCGLCSMHLGGYCPGCGGGAGNQPCKIAKCSLEHGKVAYCNECGSFPCEKYPEEDEFDSFITYQNRYRDFEKLKKIGVEAYQKEQSDKVTILNELIENYNDGRKKTLFCLAVNLLELDVLSPISRNNTAFWRAAARQEIYMEFLKNLPGAGSGQPVTCSTSGMGLRLK